MMQPSYFDLGSELMPYNDYGLISERRSRAKAERSRPEGAKSARPPLRSVV